MHDELLARTRELIARCECDHGCPTCVGPVGDTGRLAKTVALRILDLLGAASRWLPTHDAGAADPMLEASAAVTPSPLSASRVSV